ncbi:MAG: hypothetical protein ACP5G1_00160 [Nanopusillaceae archaeon]
MRYSLMIKVEKILKLDGNPDIIWYINEKTKNKNDIVDILETLKNYKERFRKKGKMNILIVGDVDKDIIKKYEDYFNIVIQKDVQEKITKFLNK